MLTLACLRRWELSALRWTDIHLQWGELSFSKGRVDKPRSEDDPQSLKETQFLPRTVSGRPCSEDPRNWTINGHLTARTANRRRRVRPADAPLGLDGPRRRPSARRPRDIGRFTTSAAENMKVCSPPCVRSLPHCVRRGRHHGDQHGRSSAPLRVSSWSAWPFAVASLRWLFSSVRWSSSDQLQR